MHTRSIFISPRDRALSAYFDGQTRKAKCLRNAANFIIRNLRTGLSKDPGARTENETSVIRTVREGIEKYNAHLHDRTRKNVVKAGRMGCPALRREAIVHEAYEKDKAEFRCPDKGRWMLSYEELDAVMKHTRNPDYYAMPSQANQQTLKKVTQSWKSYFNSLDSYREDPSLFTGEPKQPGYTKAPRATATYTNQVVKAHASKGRTFLSFPGCSLAVCVGVESSRFIRAEVKPCHGGYRILATFEDDIKVPEPPKKAPARVLGIDPGIGNFLACATNFGAEPFIIDGMWIKSANQGFNKIRARLLSELARGYDPKEAPKDSKRLSAISRKRDGQFRDFFYKAAHYIVNHCVRNGVGAIVYGHNKLQKQRVNMGDNTDQQFVSIPYARFWQILVHVAAKAGIPVIETEESYTSKASLADGDALPVYGKGDGQHKFSGKRVTRGQYRTASGLVLNADINGAANIIRKAYPDAFKGVEDYSYLCRTVRRVTRENLCGVNVKRGKKPGRPKRQGMRPFLHHERMAKKQMYMLLFGATSAKDKAAYIEAAKKAKAARKAA